MSGNPAPVRFILSSQICLFAYNQLYHTHKVYPTLPHITSKRNRLCLAYYTADFSKPIYTHASLRQFIPHAFLKQPTHVGHFIIQSTIHAWIHPNARESPRTLPTDVLGISALVCNEQPIFSASSRQCAFVSAPRPLTKGFILSLSNLLAIHLCFSFLWLAPPPGLLQAAALK